MDGRLSSSLGEDTSSAPHDVLAAWIADQRSVGAQRLWLKDQPLDGLAVFCETQRRRPVFSRAEKALVECRIDGGGALGVSKGERRVDCDRGRSQRRASQEN